MYSAYMYIHKCARLRLRKIRHSRISQAWYNGSAGIPTREEIEGTWIRGIFEACFRWAKHRRVKQHEDGME